MPEFRKQAMTAVSDIAAQISVSAIVGSVWELDSCHASAGWHPEQNKDWIPAFAGMTVNAALLIDAGKIVHVQAKTMLPNYGVFDEKRLFSAGAGTQIIEWRGHNIAMLICEDVWHEEMITPLKNQNLDTIFVINASPFEIGKYEQRLEVAKKAAVSANAQLYYVNMVGGQDDIVFDGGSFVMDAKGEVIFLLPQFEAAVENVDKISHFVRDDNEEIWNAMKLGLSDYVRKNSFSKVIIGLSGGIDSAVTATCAVDALGAGNVLGVLMPSPYSSQHSIDDALESAALLGIKTRTIPIVSGMKMFDELLTPEFDKSGWMEQPEIGGNLQARLRGVILMGLSNSLGGLVLSTGNKSEIAVGYSTLYGDSCGAYNVLKDIYKTQVYALANWRNQQSKVIPENSISKAPSAELKPEQKDVDNLPPYDILDDILQKHIEQRMSAQEIIATGHDALMVQKVLRLVRINEYKRRQSCPGVKITPMLFGKDRRYPITNKF
jgi:NAD+ synthetase